MLLSRVDLSRQDLHLCSELTLDRAWGDAALRSRDFRVSRGESHQGRACLTRSVSLLEEARLGRLKMPSQPLRPRDNRLRSTCDRSTFCYHDIVCSFPSPPSTTSECYFLLSLVMFVTRKYRIGQFNSFFKSVSIYCSLSGMQRLTSLSILGANSTVQ